MTLDRRELGTMLAALRLWQLVCRPGTKNMFVPGTRTIAESQWQAMRNIADDGDTLDPLDGAEIDTLCEKLNLRGGH